MVDTTNDEPCIRLPGVVPVRIWKLGMATDPHPTQEFILSLGLVNKWILCLGWCACVCVYQLYICIYNSTGMDEGKEVWICIWVYLYSICICEWMCLSLSVSWCYLAKVGNVDQVWKMNRERCARDRANWSNVVYIESTFCQWSELGHLKWWEKTTEVCCAWLWTGRSDFSALKMTVREWMQERAAPLRLFLVYRKPILPLVT